MKLYFNDRNNKMYCIEVHDIPKRFKTYWDPVYRIDEYFINYETAKFLLEKKDIIPSRMRLYVAHNHANMYLRTMRLSDAYTKKHKIRLLV